MKTTYKNNRMPNGTLHGKPGEPSRHGQASTSLKAIDKSGADPLEQLLQDARTEYDDLWMEEAESRMPEGLQARMQATIDRLASESSEKNAKPAANDSNKGASARIEIPPRIGSRRIWLRIAACALIVVALGIVYQRQDNDTPQYAFVDTCKTVEEAELQMERALSLINRKSNEGLAMAAENMQPLQESEKDLSRFISFE